jgi:MFS family permease
VEKRWLILAVLFLAQTATGFQYQSVGSVSSSLVKDLSIDYARLGALIGLYQLPGIILSFPGSLLGKRFGDKRVVMIALGLMAVGGATIGLSDLYTLASAGRLLSGAGAILLNVFTAKMVADWFSGRGIVTAMAILVTSWPFGIALALVSLGPLAVSSSWSTAMFLTAVVCVIASALVAAFYRSPPIVSDEQVAQSTGLGLSWREVYLAVLAGLIWALPNVGFAVLPGFAPGFLATTGYTIVEAGSLVSVASWLLVLSLPLGGAIAERLGHPNLIMVTCFLGIGVATCLLPYWAYPLVFLIALGLLYGPPPGIIMSLPVEVLRPENRAPGMGIFYTCYYGVVAALTALAGFSRDITQNSGAPLVFGGMLLFVTTVILGLFRALQKRGTSMSVA